jgi:hypothetical protein
MYHRNKVNTDEFWKYELVKNRFSEIDASVKEVLWKKQLGRHLEEEGSAPSPLHRQDESVEMKSSVQESSGSLRSSINGSVSQDIEESMDYSETLEVTNNAEINQNNDYNNNNDVIVAMRSSVQNFIIQEPRELASSLPPVQIHLQSAKAQSQMSSSLPINQIQMSSSLIPSVPRQMSLSTSIVQLQQTPSISSVEAEEDSVAIDYSVRRSTDARTSSQNERGSGNSHELIRMLVANRTNIDSNNNNVPMVLESTSAISRGSSPANSRAGSSLAHTRESSPSFVRGCSPSTARRSPPSINRTSSPSMSKINSPALVRVSSPVTICNSDLQKPQQAQAFNNNNSIRAATPVDMSKHGNRSITASPAAGEGGNSGDNSLLKALLMKNTDSSSNSLLPGSGSVPAPFFQLPENKSTSNNILRKRLLGICDNDEESSSTVPANQTSSKDDLKEYTIADDATIIADDSTTKADEQHHEDNGNDDDDILKNDVKSKNLAEEDYKHRSVLKVLLYRYNTSHRL